MEIGVSHDEVVRSWFDDFDWSDKNVNPWFIIYNNGWKEGDGPSDKFIRAQNKYKLNKIYSEMMQYKKTLK